MSELTLEPPITETFETIFIARFEGFEGTLLELAAALRAGKLEPSFVPLLELTRAVLKRFETLRTELEIVSIGSLDLASEALPHLAGVIELKARLLLPRPPKTQHHDSLEDEIDASLEDVLSGVEALAQLEGAIAFLRDRRKERSKLLVASPAPVNIPRKMRPLTQGLGDLVEAAKRRVREVNLFDLAYDRLTLPQALERLREFGHKLKKFFFGDIPAQDWGERTVLFSAMLEGVRAGELEVEQSEIYGDIEIAQIAQIAQ
jgi:segregation and condensation protein A